VAHPLSLPPDVVPDATEDTGLTSGYSTANAKLF
jgi:hypothetical protein